MKKFILSLMLVAGFTALSQFSHAQAWEANSRIFSVGIGASQFYHLDRYYYGDSRNINHTYSPVTVQLNLQGEFGVHKYLGLGFTTGIGGRGHLRHDYVGEFNVPIGMVFNFHFYQLIADKSAKNIHADKLDMYFGISGGSGIAVAYYTFSTRVLPMAFGGAHLGIRYYVTPGLGLNLEAGMGKSIVNAGLAFKL